MYPRKLFIVIVSLPKEFSSVSHCQCGLFGQTDPPGLHTKVVGSQFPSIASLKIHLKNSSLVWK